MTICVMTRPPSSDELRLLEKNEETVWLLTGQALLGPESALEGRQVWVIDEEIRELGIDCKLPGAFTAKSAHDVVEALTNAKILNF